ncbi:anti-sigma regulatory factor (Ser/Thr protein kinase) [Kitasatospora sp. GP30]|uniref:ATP-binding protein n=1 Tax=Kitasatospora sp. GP30 TaxID=3035084 RepID=UPI000C6FF0D1|nr:ATP-binding protein [Kitasatospora sp. GP30]MDH6138361.1 anti-sigma regulatory factor (Ser/Thr protein kinase) [Kitasatospora sp. GP30]
MPNQPFTTTISSSPRAPRSVGRARHAFRADADAWGIPEDTADTAELLLSELLTNACRYAKYPPGRDISATWTLTPTAGLLRIEVSDANRRLPKPRQATADDEAGRGLELLTALATTWGTDVRPFGIGKTVWVELKLPTELAATTGPGRSSD